MITRQPSFFSAAVVRRSRSTFVAEFLRPELEVALGRVRLLAVGVTVPETPVNNNDGSISCENDIRTAREPDSVQPESAAHPVKNGPHLAFRDGVSTSNAGHIPASSFAR